jgi:ubiquinone/menaquinone biosynthesis C-methylase UbiE
MLKLARQSARGALGLLGGGLPLGPPDRRRALERYREVAEDYDRRTSDGEPYRRRAVASLSLAPGDVVLDVGCGTGLNFGDIQARIGAGGG